MKIPAVLMCAAVCFVFSCSSPQERETQPAEGGINSAEMFTPASPDILSASINLTGWKELSKFRFSGELNFNRTEKRYRLLIYDFIFRTPIADISRMDDSIHIKLPAEKKSFIESPDTIIPGNYLGIDIDYYILESLLLGEIPLISKAIKEQTGKDGSGRISVQLENDSCLQVISYIEGRNPDRLIFINKKSREKIEVYMNEYKNAAGLRYYKEIKIIAPQKKTGFEIIFSGWRMSSAS